ncbi:hypothetical protein VTN96DRAFT_3368 [Rasamsonia emersonii]
MNIRGVFHIDLWMIRTRGGMVFDSVFHPSVAVIVLLARTILISDLRTRVNITVTAVGIFGKASFLKARNPQYTVQGFSLVIRIELRTPRALLVAADKHSSWLRCYHLPFMSYYRSCRRANTGSMKVPTIRITLQQVLNDRTTRGDRAERVNGNRERRRFMKWLRPASLDSSTLRRFR